MPGPERPSIAGEIEAAERRLGADEARLEAGRAAREAAERELHDGLTRLRADFDAARATVAREVGALYQRLGRTDGDVIAAATDRDAAASEVQRLSSTVAALEAWREAVDRDLGRLTAELGQRSAAIDDVHVAIDTLGLQDERAAEIEAAMATLRAEQTELRAETDERELRTEAAEGRLAAIEASAESFSARMRTLEAGAEAAAEEVRRLAELRARLDALEHQATHTAAALRESGGAKPNLKGDSPSLGSPADAATPAAAARLRAALRGEPTRWPARPWLPAALRALAVDDPSCVTDTLVTLLPASGLLANRPLLWELTVDGRGRWVVAAPGDALAVVEHEPDPPADAPKPRFRIRGDALALAELLDGRRAGRARRQGRLGIKGRRGIAREHVAALGRATRSPADLARAGVWLDPVLLTRGLVALADPAWIGEHRVTVAVELTGHVSATFTISAAGQLTVESGPPDVRPDASVATSTLAFYRWLSGEPLDAPAAIDGDPEAVTLLAGWAERAAER